MVGSVQGEDVVAGIRTPEDLDTMKNCMPQAYDELVENCEILERHYKDMMVKFHSLFEAFDHSCHTILNLCDFQVVHSSSRIYFT